MSDFTDEDVTAGSKALRDTWDSVGPFASGEYLARSVLASVLPEYTRRKRLEWEHDEACGGLPLVEHDRELTKRVRAEALREAAEDYWRQLCPDYGFVAEWLRARGDAEANPRTCDGESAREDQ